MAMSDRTTSDRFEAIGELLFFKLPGLVIGVLGIAQVVVNFANVLLRYQFQLPIVWAEEFLALTLVWVVFLGVTMVAWRWDHLSVDLFSHKLPHRLVAVLNVLIGLSVIIACAIIALSANRVVSTMMMLNTHSIIMKYPMYLAHAPVLIGSILQIGAVLWRFGLAFADKPLLRDAVEQIVPLSPEDKLGEATL